jgi:hypothetical protein
MLEFHQIPDTNIIEFTIEGELTRADYDRLVDRMDAMIRAHGKIRMIEIIKRIGHVEASAMWKDLKWGSSHMKHFSHVAVVADQKWIEWMVAPIRMFVHAEIEVFHLDELEEARRWIREAR